MRCGSWGSRRGWGSRAAVPGPHEPPALTGASLAGKEAQVAAGILNGHGCLGSWRMVVAGGDGPRNTEATMQKLSPARAQEMARSLMQGQTRDQVQKVARDLIDWSNKSRQRLSEAVQREVKSQLKSLGVAGRDEVDALKRRVRELERQLGGGATTAKKPAARSRAKKPTSAKKRSTARPAKA
ncbi:MAG: hypothetical protein E6G55_06830 [Actinobacteria bacterium]|nr:MAG: hypothetical protein E6G61_03800 [Actinomycetota bacterium]TMK46104.1 MAG: hypothetical protein E6G55_06830 [Actinomycetota bacterium]TMK63710.1 MAG: hypothetical protein E6G52_07395 [Actinomycetota bacterium]